MNPDLVNASFELAGVDFTALNIKRALRDRSVRGVSPAATCFFTVWGMWNLFYYPHLGQLLSFVAGAVMTLVNCVYLGLLVQFETSERRRLQVLAARRAATNLDDLRDWVRKHLRSL